MKYDLLQLDDNRHQLQSGVDHATNQPYLRAEVEITRQEVETNVGLGDFDCRCYATAGSMDQAIRSEIANVKVACKFCIFDFQFSVFVV